MDDEDGVAYVSNLVISGTTVTGGTLTTSGEFVGTPTVQWFRVDSKGAKTEIDGAGTLSLPLPALVGAHQLGNAGMAVAAARLLGLPPDSLREVSLREIANQFRAPSQPQVQTQSPR
jgi:UDP-N-acetylmuramyl tripeptide synthase